MLSAFLQWLAFDYPDVDIRRLGGATIFNPGVFSMAVNWLIVCVLGAIGWGFFTYGKFELEKQEKNDSDDAL